jgi:hypothetical protein
MQDSRALRLLSGKEEYATLQQEHLCSVARYSQACADRLYPLIEFLFINIYANIAEFSVFCLFLLQNLTTVKLTIIEYVHPLPSFIETCGNVEEQRATAED